jgi:hypothetical protein
MCSSTTAERQSLASRDRTCCLRRCLPARPLRYYGFRGSIAHPTQSLCTLRTRRRRRPRNTRYRAPATAYPDRSLTGRTTPAFLAHKQSILSLRLYGLRGACHRARIRATRWLAMTSKHTFTPSPRHAPEPLMNLPPLEGVGNAGCPLHPRPRVHLVLVERTRVTTSTPESPDVPARNGFNGFLRALPGDRALLPPSLSGYVLSKPGWADATPRT